MKLTLKTFKGLEPALAQELEALGAQNIEILNRAVACEGDQALLYRANYEIRTAICILKPIAEFDIKTQDDLYKIVSEMAWEKMFCVDSKMLVDAFCMDSVYTHTRFAAQKVKDAICDRFRRLFNKRPYVDKDNPQIRVDVYMYRNHCIISLNASGDTLNKRNYRHVTNAAPINEVLAAGMIALSGWDTKSNFYDPMCGSGTLLIEACMLACKMPAQYYRRSFGFQYWNDYDRLLWESIRKESNNKICDPECEIFGSDIAMNSLEMARENIKEARLHKDIELIHGDFLNLEKPCEHATIITNPPYGERLKTEQEISEFYAAIGSRLKHHYVDCTAWMISSDMEALKLVGLHPSRKITLWNGPLECRFVRFDLYADSKKGAKMKAVDPELDEL